MANEHIPRSHPVTSEAEPRRSIRVLHLEDDPNDAELVRAALVADGLVFEITVVSNRNAFASALDRGGFDLILSDFNLPTIDGLMALALAKEKSLDTPFILVSGTVGEEAAIESVRSGATDYVLKHRLTRLAPAARRALAEAAERNESQSKSRFLSTMSHELRTPLNSIIGFSELLEQELPGPLNETQREFVGNVLASSRHLLALINDVLDLSKIEAGRMELACEWVVLCQLVDAVRGIIWPLATQRQISLEIDVASELPKLYLDPMRVKQILYNLLSNAIKFTPAGGHVRLEARAVGGGMRLIVSDTGIGIRREDLPRLFHEFERIDTSSGEATEGTGLGLALTRRLTELHGGVIQVESELGRGSSFIINLPIMSQAADVASMETGQ